MLSGLEARSAGADGTGSAFVRADGSECGVKGVLEDD